MDVIAAIATPPGIGGIAVIRVSGEGVFEIIPKIARTKRPIKEARGGSILFGHIVDPKDGSIIDQVLFHIFRKPHSYTGEDMIEISCHGGRLVPKLILDLLIENGARLAKPGEFTERAFLNGKLDLIQAAAVLDIINARTKEGIKRAINRLEGKVTDYVKKLEKELLGVIVEMEARIEFEEDVPPLEDRWISEKLRGLIKDIEEFIGKGEKGRYYLEGLRVVIIGPPNVGKSTLFNRLLGQERAIVTEIPGTTRDVITEELIIDGVPVVLHDTAGLRKTEDRVERIGVNLAEKVSKEADIIIELRDALEGCEFEKREDSRTLKVCNKVDLNPGVKKDRDDVVYISALKGQGIQELKERLSERVKELTGLSDISLAEREIGLLKSALEDIRESLNAHMQKLGMDIVVYHLRMAHFRLQEIVGFRDLPEVVLNEIFKNFCVGK